MSKPIKIEYLADVAQYLRETKKVEVSTEDIADALVATSHDAQDLERKLSKAMRDAAKDTETLERAVREIPRATDEAADQAARDFDRIGDSAADAGRDVGGEFRQNLGESLASGDLEDMFADTLGGLVGSMSGPIGLGVAAVGGAALAVFNSVKQHAEEMKAAIEGTFTTMWGNIVEETGDAFGKIEANINVPALVSKEFTRLWEEEPEGMKTLVEQAKQLGIAAGDIVLARAGDEAAIRRVRAALDDAVAGTGLNVEGARQWSEEIGGVADAIDQGEAALQRTISTTDAYNSSIRDLPSQWGSVEDAIDKVATSTEGVVDEARKAKIEAADINLDGFLSDAEIAKAKLQELDAATFKPKPITVKFNFSDPYWQQQFEGGFNSASFSGYGKPTLGYSPIAQSKQRAD